MICIHSKNFGFITVLLILKLSYGVQSLRRVSNTSLPLKGDVIVYLNSIERVVEFCKTQTTDIDINLAFGLFLLNVNFKNVILKKKSSVPTSLQVNLTRIERASSALLEFFQDMVNKGQDPTAIIDKRQPRFATKSPNSSHVSTIRLSVGCAGGYPYLSMEGYPMRTNTMKVLTKRKELLTKFPSWKEYVLRVNDFLTSSPTPVQSDRCLDRLERSQSKLYGPPYKCSTISNECNRLIYNGTDFGYAITHRLIFLLAARYSRRCYVYSPQVDSHLVSRLCSAMYNEAQYIAANRYMNADLLMEQMVLCSLAGHADFLQREWLATMLQLQTSYGCFKIHRHSIMRWEPPAKLAVAKWQLARNGTQAIMDGECNGHITAVAVATFSVAVRFIIETYY